MTYETEIIWRTSRFLKPGEAEMIERAQEVLRSGGLQPVAPKIADEIEHCRNQPKYLKLTP